MSEFVIEKIKQKFWRNATFFIAGSVYLVIGIFLFRYYRYFMQDDAVCYFSIAQKYAAGNLSGAVNGYWGPLFSWLLMPLVFLKFNLVEAVKILQLFIGFLLLISVNIFIDRLKLVNRIKNYLKFVFIPIILYFVYSEISPDLLVVLILTCYLNILLSDAFYKNKTYGIGIGLMGGLLYLAKSYGFYFFIVHFLFFSVVFYIMAFSERERRNVLSVTLLGLIIFLLVSALWVYVISGKYNHFTLGSTSRFTYELRGPESMGYPMIYQGLLAPPDRVAISAWDDPSYLKMLSWSPFSSSANFIYSLKLIFWNMISAFRTFNLFSYLLIPIAGGVLALLLINASTINNFLSFIKDEKIIVWSFITTIIYTAGYILVAVVPRYLWIDYVLLVLVGGYFLNFLFQKLRLEPLFQNIILIFFAVLIILTPIKVLRANINNSGEDLYGLGRILASDGIGGKIASNPNRSYVNWQKTSILSYYLKAQYFGQPRVGASKREIIEELDKYDIDYYFVWSEDYEMDQKEWRREQLDLPVRELKIYKKI